MTNGPRRVELFSDAAFSDYRALEAEPEALAGAEPEALAGAEPERAESG